MQDNENDITDFYKSVNPDKAEMDDDLVILVINREIIPKTIRYREVNKGFKGAIEDTSGDKYYFVYVPELSFKLVKAETEGQLNELNNMFSKSSYGVDLVKAGQVSHDASEDNEDLFNIEEEKKAVGGGQASGQSQTGVSESESISSTPDMPGVGFDWHGDSFQRSFQSNMGEGIDLVKSFTTKLQDSIPDRYKPASPLEIRYLTEVLRYTKADVSKGMRVSNFNKSKYLQWIKQQAQEKTSKLENWLSK